MFVTEHRRKVGTTTPLNTHITNLIKQGYEIRTTTGFSVKSSVDMHMHDPNTMYIHTSPGQPAHVSAGNTKSARTSINQTCPKCGKHAFKSVKINGGAPAMFCESCRHVDYATTFAGSDEPTYQGQRYTIQMGKTPADITLKAIEVK